MSKIRRCLKYAAYVLLPLLVLIAGCWFWLFYGSLPDYAGQARLPGLSAKVDVYRDAYGVPHIFAANQADALHALGYLHASERFFQMEMQRRAGQGRLAEAVGTDLLGVDKFVRTLGLYDLAESSYAAMSPDAQALFQAYADGVNDWLETHRHALPPEFTLLGITPDPWQPADSVVWGKLMALELSHNYRLEELRAELAPKLSPAQMQSLFPAWGNDPVTMEPKLTRKAELQENETPAFAGVTHFSEEARTKNTVMPAQAGIPFSSQDAQQKLAAVIGLEHAASNEWVISGAHTQSGKPVLANDPHLSLEAPVLWYLARIVTPQFSVKGATVPGLPVVLLGQNTNIAWGMTTTNSDVQDLFIETVDPKNPANYLTPSGSVPFATHKEAIHIKGREAIVVTIRATRHGPVLSDLDPDMAKLAGPGKVVALAFTGLGDKDRTAEALLRINRAENWREFMAAMKLYQAPPQNIVFADIKGDIGFINPGLVPIRKSGDGTMPADGASGNNDWKGMIPFDEWPKLFNPASGFVFNANNALVGANSRNFYGVDWEEPYRAERIQQFFDTTDQHTLDSSAEMQGDHVSLAARQLLPYLLRLNFESNSDHPDPRAAEALDMLRGWDGTMDKDRPEPLIFEAWLAAMHQQLLVEPARMSLKERGPFAADSIALILNSNNNGWCDPAHCRAIASQAFSDALSWATERQGHDMHRWRWGAEHVALLRNKVFGHIPLLSRISDLSLPSSGDFYTLDRGGNFGGSPDMPFAREHGGGYRAIYDLSNPDRSRFIIATGESGGIMSRHYGDMVKMWNQVKSVTLSGTSKDFAAANAPLLEFTP